MIVLSSSYYGRVKTRDEILYDLKLSITKNLEVINNALLNKTNFNEIVTDVKGIKLCEFKESIYDSIAMVNNVSLNKNDVIISNSEKIYSDFSCLVNNLISKNKNENLFNDKLYGYLERLQSYDNITPHSLNQYNKFAQTLNNIITNSEILFSSKLKIIDEEFCKLFDCLESDQQNYESKSNSKETNSVIKKLYNLNIDLDLSIKEDYEKLVSILEERYIDEAIKKVLSKMGYLNPTVLDIDSIEGSCYENEKLLNHLFIANDEDKLIIESVYKNDIYNQSENQSLAENMKLSCHQNELLIQEIGKYGIQFELFYKEDPTLDNISIIQNEVEKKKQSLIKNKEKHIND